MHYLKVMLFRISTTETEVGEDCMLLALSSFNILSSIIRILLNCSVQMNLHQLKHCFIHKVDLHLHRFCPHFISFHPK